MLRRHSPGRPGCRRSDPTASGQAPQRSRRCMQARLASCQRSRSSLHPSKRHTWTGRDLPGAAYWRLRAPFMRALKWSPWEQARWGRPPRKPAAPCGTFQTCCCAARGHAVSRPVFDLRLQWQAAAQLEAPRAGPVVVHAVSVGLQLGGRLAVGLFQPAPPAPSAHSACQPGRPACEADGAAATLCTAAAGRTHLSCSW